ncbi:MAG: hypothetical protein HZA51_15190 [Planctomycetes bacterium]|nr:hypothetical protein [Planctomycetota bacterium]
MNESPLSGGMLAQELQRDLEDLDLFREALTKMKETAASDAAFLVDDRPKLTLVRPEDHDESAASVSHDDTLDSAAVTDLEEDFGELWLESLTGNVAADATVSGATSEAPAAPVVSKHAAAEMLDDDHEFHHHDHSAVEDVVLSNPLESLEEVDESSNADAPVAVSKPAAVVGSQRGPIRHRIGSGKLAPTKLNWKPGDPFGCSDDARRFRWEVMLTTACVTAMCGLTCIWLLRTILA